MKAAFLTLVLFFVVLLSALSAVLAGDPLAWVESFDCLVEEGDIHKCIPQDKSGAMALPMAAGAVLPRKRMCKAAEDILCQLAWGWDCKEHAAHHYRLGAAHVRAAANVRDILMDVAGYKWCSISTIWIPKESCLMNAKDPVGGCQDCLAKYYGWCEANDPNKQ